MTDADKLQKYETIMKRAAAICGSEEDWERVDELVYSLYSSYTYERDMAKNYAQAFHEKVKDIPHYAPWAYDENQNDTN